MYVRTLEKVLMIYWIKVNVIGLVALGYKSITMA